MTPLAQLETAETAETAGTAETVLAYSGGVINRTASQRTEPGWVDAILAKEARG